MGGGLWYNPAMTMFPIPYLQRAAAAIPFRGRPDRITLLLVALSLLAAGFVLLRAYLSGGLGLNGPCITFIALARNILAGNGLVEILATDAGGLEPFVLRPALYSFVLVIFSFGVFDPYAVAAPVNAAIVAITVFAAGNYLRRRLESRFVLWSAALAVASSLPLIWIASFAMSDALFALMVALALIQCDKYLDEGKTSALIWAAIFSALAWQTRYIGLALPAAIGLLLLFQPGIELRLRAGRIFVYSLIVALPMALWAAHVLSAVGIGGRRYPVDYSLADVVDNVAVAFAEGYDRILLIPFVELVPGVIWAGIAVLLALLAGAFAGILWRSRRYAELRRMPIAVFGGFALIYAAAIWGAAFSGITWDGFEVRYFVPIWIPALVVAALILDTMFGMIDRGRIAGVVRQGAARGATAALSAILVLSVAAMLTTTALDTSRVKTTGIGYVSELSALDIIRHIQDNPVDGLMHSNAPFVLYFYTDGKGEYQLIPMSRAGGYIIDDRNAGISGNEQLHRWAAGLAGGEYVVWLNAWYGNDAYDFGPAEMRASPALEPVADLDDGVIFRVKGETE